MPSHFEPCGLGQLIALRYGAVPVVRETGGLKDSVFSYNEETGKGNGFSFTNYNAHNMLFSIKRALQIFKEDNASWTTIIKSAMTSDYSWKGSSNKYKEIYKNLLSERM